MEFTSVKVSPKTKELLKKYGLYDDNADRTILRIIGHMEACQKQVHYYRSNHFILSREASALVQKYRPPYDTLSQFILFLIKHWLNDPQSIMRYFPS